MIVLNTTQGLYPKHGIVDMRLNAARQWYRKAQDGFTNQPCELVLSLRGTIAKRTSASASRLRLSTISP